VTAGPPFATTAGIALALAVAVVALVVALHGNLARARVTSAARSAAIGAARQPSPDLAMLAAQQAAIATLTDVARIGKPLVIVDVSRFRTAGRVEVTVACTVNRRPIGPIDRAVQIHQATASASAHPSLGR
jgi:hypothetical protein